MSHRATIFRTVVRTHIDHHRSPTWPKHPAYLAESRIDVGDVVKDQHAECGIDRLLAEGESLDPAEMKLDIARGTEALGRSVQHGLLPVYSDHLIADGGEFEQGPTRAAAKVGDDQARCDER